MWSVRITEWVWCVWILENEMLGKVGGARLPSVVHHDGKATYNEDPSTILSMEEPDSTFQQLFLGTLRIVDFGRSRAAK